MDGGRGGGTKGINADAIVRQEVKTVLTKLGFNDIPVVGMLSGSQIGPLPAPGFINYFPIKG